LLSSTAPKNEIVQRKPDRFVLCAPYTPVARRDWLLGNPLTFNSAEAEG
jgi:hypothetical protein